MYERFTDRARKVLQLATQEGHRLGHDELSPEHVLIGIVKEGRGVAHSVCESLGIELSLRTIREALPPAGKEWVCGGKLPQNPACKAVVERAIKEAQELAHNYVGTEHLLLGLAVDPEGLTAKLIHPKTADDLRAAVKTILTDRPKPTDENADLLEALAKRLEAAEREIRQSRIVLEILVTNARHKLNPIPTEIAAIAEALQPIAQKLLGEK